MTPLVIDASVGAALILKSQRTPAAVALFRDWPRYAVRAPYVFLLEMPWILLKHERRSGADGLAFAGLERLENLDIDVEEPLDSAELKKAFALASQKNIGFYDAMYVMLAARIGALLATRDGPQASLAHALGVEVIDIR